jgi:hypothetical protein
MEEKISIKSLLPQELEVLLAEGQTSAFLERLTDMTAATVEAMEIGQEYRAFPISKEDAT